MRNKSIAAAVAAITLLIVSVPLFAHHGNAAFDNSKKATVKGTVTEWVWSNPHCFLLIDAKGDDGQVGHWTLEATAIPSLVDIGINKQAFRPGDQVAATITPVKTGQQIGRITNVVLANGKTVFFTTEGSGVAKEDDLVSINKAALAR